MRSQHSLSRVGRGLPWLTLLATATAIGLWGWLGPTPAALVFDRSAISQGELWRLLSGHWVHVEGSHALWDIAALALLGSLLEPNGRLRLALAALLGMLSVDAAIWWGAPDLAFYCGLSGMLNTLMVIGLMDRWRQDSHPLYPLIALGLGLKLLLETLQGQSLLLETEWPALPLAHLAGCAAGLLFLWGESRYLHHAAAARTPNAPNAAEAPTMPAKSIGNDDIWTAAKPSSKLPPKPPRENSPFPPAPKLP